MITKFGNLWNRVWLKKVHYRDSHWWLNMLYRNQDPWSMENPKEQFRFVETNRFIKTQVGSVGSLLEIGCGEGHQSVHFFRLCKKLYGIDVSSIAVARARKRCPGGFFQPGSVNNCQFVQDAAPFDVVTACEVLYYIKDIQETIDWMLEIARHVVVSYHVKRAEVLDRHFVSLHGVAEQVGYGDTSWKFIHLKSLTGC